MAGELKVEYTSGLNLYVALRDKAGQVRYIAGAAWETWGTGSRTAKDYAITITYDGSKFYVGDFPTDIELGEYTGQVHSRAGSDPADSDPQLLPPLRINWDGTRDGLVFLIEKVITGDPMKWSQVVTQRGEG